MTDVGRENPKCPTCDWSEVNSMSTASTHHDTEDWDPSATVIKSEADTQIHRGQGVTINLKAEPDDQNARWGGGHQFQSADSREEHVHMKWESCISGSVSSKPMDFWNAVNSGSCEKVPEIDTSKVKVEPCPVNIRMNLDCTCSDCKGEPVAAGASSDVTNREPDISSDVSKTEPVAANISSEVTKSDPVRGNNHSVVIKVEPSTVNVSCNVDRNKWTRVDKSSTNRYEPVSVHKISTHRYEPVRVDKSSTTNRYEPVRVDKISTHRYEPVRVDKSTSTNRYEPIRVDKISTHRYKPVRVDKSSSTKWYESVRVDKNSTHRYEPVRVDKNSTHRYEPVRVDKNSTHRYEPVRVDKNSTHRYEPVSVNKNSTHRYGPVRVDKSSTLRYEPVRVDKSSANRYELVSIHESSTNRCESVSVRKSSTNSSSDVRNKLVTTNANTPEFITSRQKWNNVHAGEKQTFTPFFEYLKEECKTEQRNSSTYQYKASSNSRTRSRSPYSSRRSRGESHSQNRRESRSRHRSRSRGRGRSNSRDGRQSENSSRKRSRSRRDRCSQSPPPQKRPMPGPHGCEDRILDQAHLFAGVCLDQMKPFFKSLHAHLDEIVQILIVIDKRLERIEEAMRRKELAAALAPPPQPLLPPRRYPMKDRESLMLFENEMRDLAVRRRAVQFLSSIGGTCLRDTMRRMWEQMLCPKLAVCFTLTGKGKGKGRLRDFPSLLDTVYEAVRQKYPAATFTELDDLTRYFLSLSCDRKGLRQEREREATSEN